MIEDEVDCLKKKGPTSEAFEMLRLGSDLGMENVSEVCVIRIRVNETRMAEEQSCKSVMRVYNRVELLLRDMPEPFNLCEFA